MCAAADGRDEGAGRAAVGPGQLDTTHLRVLSGGGGDEGRYVTPVLMAANVFSFSQSSFTDHSL